ncbi:MAG: P63C domain-containing protein [Candidatus Zixiibacteriota bacterium]
MSEKIPKAEYQGELKIGEMTLTCAVLDDLKTRVLSDRSVALALKRKGGGAFWRRKKDGEIMLPEYLSAKNLEPFIDEELRAKLLTPITYVAKNGVEANGIPAELLPEICDIWLKAQDKGAITETQGVTAKQAQIIIRGLAHVGIIALVDEATGYQELRDRLALQTILDKYITDEWAKWTKTFPDEYYIHLFRLKGMPYPPAPSVKKPSFVGHWTNDIVYSRLAPGVLKTLKEKNPRLSSGSRRVKQFQLLTRDFGHPKLKEHLQNVIFLMRGCTKWADFKRMLERASPKYGDSFPIGLDDISTDE